MGRVAEGWKLKLDKRTSVWFVRFRHEGRRVERSTGERDAAKARAAAARVYSAYVEGREERRVARGSVATLTELIAMWLADLDGQVTDNTLYCYARTATTHVEPHFRTLAGFTTAAIASFYRGRLRTVLRATVRSDSKVIRGFLAWCVERGHLEALPVIPPVPGAPGKRQAVGRKEKAVPITEDEALAILRELPERAPRAGYPIRARFAVQWETSLRQATIERLSVPEHYKPGAAYLVITDPIDKARFGRELPLTAGARAALDGVCPERGLIFGKVNAVSLRPWVKAAALRVLPEDRARLFSPYDFRHARITDLLVKGASLPAVAYLAGHKHLTTTNRYIQVAAQRAAAEEALRAGGVSGGETGDTTRKPERK